MAGHFVLPIKLEMAVFLCCGLLMACFAERKYSGDGQMIDNGPFAANDRYVVNLGPIDLTSKQTRSYRLNSLPPESFVFGIDIQVPDGKRAELEKKRTTVSISMALIEESGKIAMQVAGPVRDWTWSILSVGSNSFVYVRDPNGSFFVPVKDRSYHFEVSIVDPDTSESNFEANVVLKSGGWK